MILRKSYHTNPMFPTFNYMLGASEALLALEVQTPTVRFNKRLVVFHMYISQPNEIDNNFRFEAMQVYINGQKHLTDVRL